ncbi:MAG: hypothetical protein ACXWXH_10955 [Aeromicrobium sp.]
MEFVDSIRFIEQLPTPTPSPTTDLAPRATPPIASAFGTVFSYVPPRADAVRWVTPSAGQFGFEDPHATSRVTRRGVVVASMDHAWVHDCETGDRAPIRTAPADLLEDLSAIGRFAYGEPRQISIDGRAAIEARRTLSERSAECQADLHIDPLTQGLGNSYITLWPTANSILVDVAGRTFLIEIWANTDQDLEAWLPTAMDFVNSIQFTAQP